MASFITNKENEKDKNQLSYSSTISTPSKTVTKNVISTPKTINKQSMKKTLSTTKSNSKCTNNTPFKKESYISSPSSSTTIGSQALEQARIAKLQNTSEKISLVANLKEKWAKEKEEILTHQATKRAKELKQQQDHSAFIKEKRRQNSIAERQYTKTIKECENEMFAAFVEDRIFQANEVEKLQKERRRRSVMINTEILAKAKQRSLEISLRKAEEERTLLESRRLDAIALEKFKEEEEDRKRESLLFRADIFHNQKKVETQIINQSMEFEKSLLDSKYEDWQSLQQSKDKEEQRKRESISNRIDLWRKGKGKQLETDEYKQKEETSLLLSRYEDWKDLEEYKKQSVMKRRESIVNRLDKWRLEREYTNWEKAEEEEALEYEFELKAQEVEDIKKYQTEMSKSKRESLAYRLDKAKRDKMYDEGQVSLQQVINEEEYKLKQEDHQAMQQYHQEMNELRRQSLIYRRQAEALGKMRLQGHQDIQKQQELQEFITREEEWKDIQNYKQHLQEEKRKSLAKRLAEARKAEQQDLEKHRLELDNIHQELERRREDWIDVENYKFQQKMKSRQSVLLRLESWRDQRLAEEKLEAKKRLVEEENMRLRYQDWIDLQQAKGAMKKS